MSEGFDRVFNRIKHDAEALKRETGRTFSFKDAMQRAYEAGRMTRQFETQATQMRAAEVQRHAQCAMPSLNEYLAQGQQVRVHSHGMSDPGHSHGSNQQQAQNRNAQRDADMYLAGVADGKRDAKRRFEHEAEMRDINEARAAIAEGVRETYNRLSSISQTDARLGYLWARDE